MLLLALPVHIHSTHSVIVCCIGHFEVLEKKTSPLKIFTRASNVGTSQSCTDVAYVHCEQTSLSVYKFKYMKQICSCSKRMAKERFIDCTVLALSLFYDLSPFLVLTRAEFESGQCSRQNVQ